MTDYALFFGIFSAGAVFGALAHYVAIWLSRRDEQPRAPIIRSE